MKPSGNCGGIRSRLGVSISPGRVRIECQTLEVLLRIAYVANGRDPLFVDPTLYTQAFKGLPAWVASERYTIEAKADERPSREAMLGPMLRALPEDRFKVRVRRESREVPAYEPLAEKRTKLQPAKEGTCAMFTAENPEPPKGSHLCGVLVRSLNPAAAPATFYGATMADSAADYRAL